ncbi:hypothetical protein LCGC14_1977250, partial [marine sediment metagenome]
DAECEQIRILVTKILGDDLAADVTVTWYYDMDAAARPPTEHALARAGLYDHRPVTWAAAGLLLDDALATEKLDLPVLFGNAHPVEVEVGPGKGAFLLRRAAARPEVNFLGVEWALSYACYGADRAFRAGLQNVKLLCGDAETVFRCAVPRQAIQRVHIYFPDPWPKQRHRHRRLVKVPFLRDVREALLLGGSLNIVTDHEEYFRRIRLTVMMTEGLAEVPFVGQADEWLVGSNFERKYAASGKKFYAVSAVRLR